jgi:metallo-beta-lactamase class B
VFDNLYWLGTRQHSSWALTTSEGIIVIDTNFSWAIEPEIVEGLTKLGLNPRDIKYVIISHAHGDHDQGAALLQSRFGAKVVMGAADWEATLQRPATAAGGVPKRDIAVGLEGMKLTLGDVTVDIVATPGHTPGTLSYVFPVKDQGRTVMVAYSGGTLTGAFGTNAARWDEYVASQKKTSNRSQTGDRRSPSLRHRSGRCAALLHRHGGMRDGLQVARGRQIDRELLKLQWQVLD